MEQKIRHDVYLGHNIRRLRLSRGLTQEQTTARMQILAAASAEELMQKSKPAYKISALRNFLL